MTSGPLHAQEEEDDDARATTRPGGGRARTVYSRSATRVRKAGIEMPELLHVEEAPYPDEAKAAGAEGDVVLRLTISVRGEVTDAEVVEGAGHGFDEAARAAALKFQFKPARRRGKAVPVRIDYKYSFKLESVDLENETTTPARSSAELQKGTVPGGSGHVERLAEPRTRARRAGVALPEIVHFAEATYPSDAWKEGVEAEVLLRLRVNARGAVTRADVLERAGRGFDEAAQRAALKFRFKPARRGRRTLPVSVDFRYSFILGHVELDEEPSERAGDLAGQVRVADTDAALAGAGVLVRAADGREYRASADAEGRWELRDLPAGKYRVRILAQGFREVDETEEVSVGEATEVTYRLALESRGFEVTVQGERPPREVTKRRLERREIDRMPGTGGDALRSVQSLPGVARPPLLAGFLIVRGSAPEDSQTFVDTANVPLIYHFLGLSSILPTELLDRIDYYPGSFSARYGRGMGGIVDAALRSPDTQCYAAYMRPSDETGCYHGLVQGDAIAGRLLLQGPIFGSKDWSFAVAGQRSWIDIAYKPVLERTGGTITQAPVYYDYQVITEYKPNANHRLSLRFFGFNDRLEALFKDPAAVDPAFGGNISLSTNFMTGQMLYEGKLGQDVELSTMLAGGQAGLRFAIGSYLFDLNSYPLQARSEIGWRMTIGIKLNLGVDVLAAPYDANVIFPPPPRPGEPNPGPTTGKRPKEAREKSSVFRPGAYAEFELQPWSRLRVVPGARVDYARDSGSADFSPRINARFDIVPGRPTEHGGSSRTTLKGGVGIFYQPPQFQETNEVYGTPGLRSNRSIHYSLGLERELSRQVELSAEGFYKQIDSWVASELSDDGGFEYDNRGTGSIIGLETLLKYKPDKRFFGWLAYTLSRSVRRNRPEDDEYLFQYDQTHNLVALGSYRMGDGWEFGARFRLISGPLATPVPKPPGLPALYDADAGAYTPLPGRPFSERLPIFHQLDIRVDKRWQFKRWRLSAYLDLQNAYNNRPVEALLYSYNFAQKTYAYGLPIIPSLGLRGEF
ncbi:MAG TPA: TonB family protein [Polyangiaceae bacterium]|nr:TonB family protein [Polyangiaceae bacterium]